MKKLICVLLAVLLTSGMALAAVFSDVPESNWAYSYVERAYTEGVVQGMGDGTYDPDGPLTYAQFVTVIARKYFASELQTAYRSPEFLSLGGSEKDYDSWWYPAWSVYSAEGLLGTKKISVSDFAAAPIPRQDMALVIHNTAKKLLRGDIAGSASIPDIAKADASKNLDTAQVGAEKLDAMTDELKAAAAFCYSAGIINGVDGAGNFAPTDSVTRAQLAAIYCRTSDILPKLIKDAEEGGSSSSEVPVSTDDPAVQYILDKTNEVRAGLDRRQLELDAGLMEAAAIRAREIAESFSHNRPSGELYTDAIPSSVSYTQSAENIAEAGSVEEAMNAWLDSESHRMNIESSRYGKIGIGVYGRYYVQIFADKPWATE